MTTFGAAWRAEWRHLGNYRLDLALVTWLPALLLLLMGGMISYGTPQGLGVVVIDHDRSAASRAVIRTVEHVPALAVVAEVNSLPAALTALRREQAVVILVLPAGLGAPAIAAATPKVQILYQSAFLSTGTLSSTFLRVAVLAALAERLPHETGLGGAPLLRAPLPGVEVTILGNAGLSLEWYLGLLVGPGILHLLIAVLCVASLGREVEDGSLARWARRVRYPVPALAGRMSPYVIIGTAWSILWLLWLTLGHGYRFDGPIVLVVIGLFLLHAATAAISALLVAVTRKVGTSLSISVIYAGSALAYSGASLPITGAPLIPRLWSDALPLTHYLSLQMDQAIGVSSRPFVVEASILLLYVVVVGSTAVGVLGISGRRAT